MFEWLQEFFSNEQNLWHVLSWTFSFVGLAGTLINAERNKWGFYLWLVSNLYMVIRFWYIGEYAQCVLFFAYFILAIRGIVSWTKKEKQQEMELQQAQKAETV